MYKINLESYSSVFAVPTQLTDNHLKLAGSTQLKVLLYSYRHPEKEINTEELSAILGISNGDICDALQYWVECGFISKDGIKIQPEKTISDPVNKQEIPVITETVTVNELPVSKKEELHIYKPTQKQVATRLDESAELRSLFFELQRILQRAIGFDTQATILYLMDYGGLPAAVIIMLCEYLVSNGQTGIRAIEKTGLSWAEKEINTFEKANAQIERLENTTQQWQQLKIMIGLENDKPTQSQRNYLDIWLNEYMFSLDVIYYSYEKMIEKTGKLNFKYMNTMLTDWYSKNLKSVDAIEQCNEEFKSKINETKEKTENKTKKNTKSPPSYDIDKAFGKFELPTKTKRGQ